MKKARREKQEGRSRKQQEEDGERGGRGLGGSHCCQVVVRVSSWKPGSESLERMMSLGDPKTRLQSNISSSRGSWEVILKNLLV